MGAILVRLDLKANMEPAFGGPPRPAKGWKMISRHWLLAMAMRDATAGTPLKRFVGVPC